MMDLVRLPAAAGVPPTGRFMRVLRDIAMGRGPAGLPGRLALIVVILMISGVAVLAATPPAIRVVLDRNYPPYSFVSHDGRLQGIAVDQWNAWQRQTGIKVELQALDWAEAVGQMRAGGFDVIDLIVETEERRGYLDFTPPYAWIEADIFFRIPISGLTNLDTLRGFPVGVMAGDQHIDKLRAAGITTLVPFPNCEAMVAAAKERKINVFIADAGPGHYFLNKAGIEAEFRHSTPVFRDGLQRAVRKGNSGLLRTVTQGFAAIPPDELKRIDEKWFGRTVESYRQYLVYAGWFALGASGLIAVLVGWNRTLRMKVLQRTAALTESERRFRQIAENIDEAVWLATADLSQTLYVSPAYEAVWERARADLDGNPRSPAAELHPIDRARVLEAIEQGSDRGFEVEYRVVRKDGSVRWIRERGFPIQDEAGRAYRIAGIVEDITARKAAADVLRQAEDRMRLLIDTIPTLAWSIRPDGAVDFVNRPWLDYTGLSLDAVVTEPGQVIHPEDRIRVMTAWQADMAAERPFEAEMRLRRADGEYRWFLVRTAPLRDEHGGIVKWFGASVDLHDRREAEHSVRQRKQQLHELIRRLHTAREEEAKRIARELHDDLGQQLTALRLQLDTLDLFLSAATPEQRAQIASMHALVTHTIERVQSIAGELRLGHLDLLGLTAAIDWQLKEFSRRSAISCRVTRLDEIAHLSDAQNTAVYRILQEALTNIVRHAHATQVEVSLQAQPHQLTLEVRDNGCGITAAELSDHRSIGLLGMHERAQIVGGSVTITAGPDGGTRVSVKIPLAQPPRVLA